MKALVIYDSEYGNTEHAARAIVDSLAADARLLRASEARPADLNGIDLLVAGSPTQGGKPTAALKTLLDAIPAKGLKGIPAAAFDTRISASDSGLPLRLLMKLIGYAAPRIASGLAEKGARLMLPPEGFIVEGKEGPLREGEVLRAGDWAQQLQAATQAAVR
jgi:flavodoxin I